MTRHPLAQHRQLVAADARDALEEGLLPRLQLDQLHALQRLGGGVDAVVLHLHQLRLDLGEVRRHHAGERDHQQDHHRAGERGETELQVSAVESVHLVEQHDERHDDLEGSGPDGLEVAVREGENEEVRGDILELLTVHLHQIHDLALIELGAGGGTQTQ